MSYGREQHKSSLKIILPVEVLFAFLNALHFHKEAPNLPKTFMCLIIMHRLLLGKFYIPVLLELLCLLLLLKRGGTVLSVRNTQTKCYWLKGMYW